jgi:hypothetical protein
MDLQQTLPGLEVSDDEEFQDDLYARRSKKKIKFSKSDDKNEFYASIENLKSKNESGDDDDDELLDTNEDGEEEKNGIASENDDEDENPLIQDLVDGNKQEKRKMNTNIWFNKVFNLFFTI